MAEPMPPEAPVTSTMDIWLRLRCAAQAPTVSRGTLAAQLPGSAARSGASAEIGRPARVSDPLERTSDFQQPSLVEARSDKVNAHRQSRYEPCRYREARPARHGGRGAHRWPAAAVFVAIAPDVIDQLGRPVARGHQRID